MQMTKPRSKPKTKSNGLRILCVDDDDDLTRVLKARLLRHNVDVTRAISGRDGLRFARGHRPAAIITDLGMPGGDGEYLIRRLKSRASTASIPIIILSGIDDPERISEAYRLGVTTILRKPIRFDDLYTELDNVLKASDSARNGFNAPQDHSPGSLRSRTGKIFRIDRCMNTSTPSIRS